MSNTIRIKDYTHVKMEGPAAAAITPGSFVSFNASGQVTNAGADFAGVKMVATEDEFQGKAIDDAYASGDIVQVMVPRSGDVVYAIASAAIVVGALISTAANGKVVTATTGDVLGEALTAAAADDDRIEILIK